MNSNNEGAGTILTSMSYTREKIVLRNGLRLLLDARQSNESVSVTCLVRAGSQEDPIKKSGLAHVVEHLLFRTRLNSENQSLLKALEDNGGQVEAFTGVDRTVYSIRVHKDDISDALGLLSLVICDLPSDPESLALEKAIVKEELRLIGEDNRYALQRNKYELLGGDESLRHSVGGSAKTLRKISLKDTREFYEKYYVGSNMVLAIVGNFDPKEIVSDLEALFGSVKSGTSPVKPYTLDGVGPKLKVAGVGSNLVALFFRCPSFQDRKVAAVELVSDILSMGTHSILFQRLREKRGLIYALDASLVLSTDFGSLDIITRAQNIIRALSIIIEEVLVLKNSILSEENLFVAKEGLVKRQILKFEDVREASKWYAEREMLSSRANADDFMQWIQDMNMVTAQDFHETVKELFVPENCFIYVLGFLWPWQRWSLLRRIKRFANLNDVNANIQIQRTHRADS